MLELGASVSGTEKCFNSGCGATFPSHSPGEITCVPFSQSGAVATEQTKKPRRLQIILGQMRWLCPQNKSLPRTKEKPLHMLFLGLTAGISECVRPSMQLKNGRALDSQGSGQGSHRREHQQAPGTGPANLSNLQPPSPAPAPSLCSWLPRPALARVPAPAVRLQRPGISQRRGDGKAPHRCSAELPSLLRFLERRHPATLHEAASLSLPGTCEKKQGG